MNAEEKDTNMRDQRPDDLAKRISRDSGGPGVRHLARLVGRSPSHIYNAMNGVNVSDEFYAELDAALTEWEEHPEDRATLPQIVMSTEKGLIEFEVTGDFGVRVVVKGPVENAAELEASVARLIRDIRAKDDDVADA